MTARFAADGVTIVGPSTADRGYVCEVAAALKSELGAAYIVWDGDRATVTAVWTLDPSRRTAVLEWSPLGWMGCVHLPSDAPVGDPVGDVVTAVCLAVRGVAA